jgi:ketosteroid isomerase-like protein
LALTATPKLVLISGMKTKCVFSSCFALFSLALVITASAADTKAIEQILRDLDAQWSAAAGAKDLGKTVSFYSDDALVMPPNASAAVTKEAIRKSWQDLLASPGFVISWKTTKVEVAKSGDLACLSGTYEVTMNDPSGKPINDRGKYVEVWERQTDGKWKCGTDIWNSDLPATPEKK